jgi:hypothetical protein
MEEPASGRTAGYVQGMVAGAAAVLAPPTGLLLGVLLAPGLIAIMVDQRPGKPIARTVLLFGMAATISPLRSLWQLDHSMPVALALLGQPAVLAVSWMAAAFGWLLTELVPLLVGLSVSLRLRDQQTKLQRRRKALEKEWGLPAASAAAEPVVVETPALAGAAPR